MILQPVNSYHRSYARRKARRDAVLQKMAKLRAAKERKRLAAAAAEPAPSRVAGKHCYTLTVHNRITGTMHSVDLYLSDRRINAYRAEVDGMPWRDSISMTRILAAIRHKLPPFRKP